jgi:hypothetical protein
MKSISSAIITLAGAVLWLTASQVSPGVVNKFCAAFGAAVFLVGFVSWAVTMWKFRD